MASTQDINTTSMHRRNSNESEGRVNPNDPVSYTTQYAPHNPSATTAASGLPQASQTQAPAESTTTGTSTGGIFATASETAKQYLPETVVGALKNVGVMERETSVTDGTSLPSHESTFAPSRGGVGTLPGGLFETSVAKLPEEKKLQDQVGHELGREGVLGTNAEEKPVGLMDIIAEDTYPMKLSESRHNDASTGIDTASKFINLDILPTPQGTPGEGTTLNHAVPDNRPSESKTEPTPLNNGPAHMQSEPSRDLDKAINKPLPPAGGNTNDFKTTGREGKTENDLTYTEDQSKRKTARTEPSDQAGSQPTQKGVERKEEGKHDADRKPSDVSGSSEKSAKVPFTQKLKGEVKVITGKLGNNPAKVEEGQALKKGTSA